MMSFADRDVPKRQIAGTYPRGTELTRPVLGLLPEVTVGHCG